MSCRIGRHLGYAMRQQAIGACYAKALRLNSSSIADISAGKVTRHSLLISGALASPFEYISVVAHVRGKCKSRDALAGSPSVHAVCAQVTNLVSNDVRRFDDAMPYWCFLWGSPLELACVIVLLSLELGAPSAFAGVATMLLVIPLQACFCSGWYKKS